MKQITSLALVMLFAFGSSFAKDRISKHVTVKGDNVTVTYGQPSKKQGNVIPEFGKAWRTGVDEPTIVTLPKGCMFAGRQVNPGTYSLVTIPYKGEWIIYLSSNLNLDENFDAEKVKAENLLYSNELIGHSAKGVDAFTIEAVKDGLLVSWDNSNIMIPVQPW
jgi:hypothetical protein